MQTKFNESLQATIVMDDNGVVKEITHFDELFAGEGITPQMVAEHYIKQMSEQFGIGENALQHMSLKAENSWNAEGNELRFENEKLLFDNSTVSYVQTAIGFPVWGAGITIQIKHDPYRVIHSASTLLSNVTVNAPTTSALKKYEKVSLKELKEILNANLTNKKVPSELRVTGAKFFIYNYSASNREAIHEQEEESFCSHKHEFELAPVPDVIQEGGFYVVSEVKFETGTAAFPTPYIALVEIETNTILYLRALSSELTGLIFKSDPITMTGIPANLPTSSNTILNPLRSAVTLPGLIPPSSGVQQLTGNFVAIQEIETPVVASPTEPSASNFNYNSRSNEFAAVNAYYHNDDFFRFVTSLGFPAAYWGSTTFPLPIDHRGMGITMNAHCIGNGSGGIGHACYALADPTNTSSPLGIAADKRVVLHELGGHGILYCHVNSPNFGFAHSAGDSFAAILSDPESNAPDRYATFPWLIANRRHDRSVSAGWAWGGAMDTNGYNSEQILCTTMFRIYHSIGGGSSDVNMRKFAAEFTAYLLLRAIGNLTPTHPTQTGPGLVKVTAFANELMSANMGDWTFKGHAGGAYGKVIRWAFEKQGLYQPASATPPFNTAGAAPAVDVYINDGRNGEYTYQPIYWNNQNVWNRLAADGNTTHQEPVVGVTNYAYVKIKNRGTTTATGVIVKAYHANPGVGLLWPTDWIPMTTSQLSAPNVAPNHTAEITVGPFAWVPQHIGHECMLMVVSASGDPSNTSNIGLGETIPEWRLIPNDNNIAQRNVAPIAGGGNISKLLASLHKRVFYIRNPFTKAAKITFEILLPKVLTDREVSLKIAEARDNILTLQRREKIPVTILAEAGILKDFDPTELGKRVFVHIKVKANGIQIGGMTYQISPSIKEATGNGGTVPKIKNPTQPQVELDTMLAEILSNPTLSDRPVKKITVKKINLDIEFED